MGNTTQQCHISLIRKGEYSSSVIPLTLGENNKLVKDIAILVLFA